VTDAGAGEIGRVRAVFGEAIELFRRVADEQAGAIVAAAAAVREALAAGRKVLVFGNGGSAADAEHFAAELVGRFGRDVERPALPVLALTSDSSVVTSVANDFGFEAVFARQVEAFGAAGDVALAITTSGTSANVNEALRWALDRSLRTVALTGGTGGETGRLADVHVHVPDASAARVQEAQRVVLHLICELVEQRGRIAPGRDE
jgi:D-sedoheptulose 7-phosphate isomerase